MDFQKIADRVYAKRVDKVVDDLEKEGILTNREADAIFNFDDLLNTIYERWNKMLKGNIFQGTTYNRDTIGDLKKWVKLLERNLKDLEG